jgi:hypothetical protein
MPTPTATRSSRSRDLLARLVAAGLVTAFVDGLWASVQAVFYGSTVARVWQGVASTVLGPPALQGGLRTTLIGVAMHVSVAFAWSAVFLFLVMRLNWVRRILDSRAGAIKVAAVYGPFIWLVMSLGVIPLLTQRPPNISYRWWVQLLGHIPFVGIPIVATLSSVRIWR